MTKVVVPFADLPLLVSPSRGPIAGRHLLEGRAVGLAHLTLVLGESHPGQSVPLHRHDVEEIIIVHAGRGTYTVGDTSVEAGPGEVVIVPSGVPHRWVNHTREPLVHTAVVPTDRFALEELELED
jgi:quercetin dioxygenase-like cupin family protein